MPIVVENHRVAQMGSVSGYQLEIALGGHGQIHTPSAGHLADADAETVQSFGVGERSSGG